MTRQPVHSRDVSPHFVSAEPRSSSNDADRQALPDKCRSQSGQHGGHGGKHARRPSPDHQGIDFLDPFEFCWGNVRRALSSPRRRRLLAHAVARQSRETASMTFLSPSRGLEIELECDFGPRLGREVARHLAHDTLHTLSPSHRLPPTLQMVQFR